MTNRRLRSLGSAFVTTLIGVFVFTSCPGDVPLPVAGWVEYQDALFVRVPGGSVNTGGGNFHSRRIDLSIDTRVGTYTVGAVYNSTWGSWQWAHEMAYWGTTFVDDAGTLIGVGEIADGAPIPGTHWVKLDADSIKTKGGLVHDFAPSGKLAAIHWLGFDYPRLRFTTTLIGGAERITAIDQCTAAATCASVYTLAYTTSGLLQTVTDRAARVASFTWDAQGRLTTAKDGLDTAKGWLGFRYEYTGTNLTAMTSSENERVEYVYDTSARLLSAKKIGDGDPISSFAYFPQQSSGYFVTLYTNPVSEMSAFSYDAYRRLFVYDDAAEITSFQWGPWRPTRVTRPDGVATNFVIANDDVTQVSEASGNVTTISYAPNAIDPGSPNARPVDVVSDSVGLVLDRGYDGQGRLTSVSNGASETTTYAWNNDSPTELASVTTPAGVLTTYTGYGEHGHPGGATTGPQSAGFSYDAVGNTLTGQDADSELSPGMGGVVSRTFDADRNIATVLLQSEDPSLHNDTMTLEYRSDGLRKAIRPPFGGDTEFDYSATGRVLARREKSSGAWVATSFGYDALDRVVSTELANGMRSELGYDGAGRVNAITSKRSGVVEETLARSFAAARLTSQVDSVFSGSESYAYDSVGRVSTITYPGGERRELLYDLRSRVTTERFIASGGTTLVELLYSYDLANRIREIRRGPLNQLLLKYTYTTGFVTQTDYGSGLRRTATPDLDMGLVETSVTTTASSQTRESTAYVHGSAYSQRNSTIGGAASAEQYFTLARGRLWDEHSASNHVWDSLSNLRKKSPSAGAQQQLSYNAEANRLVEIRDVAAPQALRHSYAYDAAGFVTSRDGVVLTYDSTGAIATIGTTAAFDHDLNGRPVSRTLNGTTKLFRFGGAVAYTTSGSPIEMDLGEVVIKLDGSTNRYRHMDFRGNVLFVTSGETVEGQATYRGFGRDTSSGTLGERGFAGGFEVPSLGLVVLGPRVLDSDAARFLSQDPVFNTVNLYAYAQGNPVYMWDPTGRITFDVGRFTIEGTGSLSLEFGKFSAGFDQAGNFMIAGHYEYSPVPGGPITVVGEFVVTFKDKGGPRGIAGLTMADAAGWTGASGGGGGGRGSAGRGGPGGQPGQPTVTPAASLSEAFAGSGLALGYGGGYAYCASPTSTPIGVRALPPFVEFLLSFAPTVVLVRWGVGIWNRRRSKVPLA